MMRMKAAVGLQGPEQTVKSSSVRLNVIPEKKKASPRDGHVKILVARQHQCVDIQKRTPLIRTGLSYML